MALPRQHNGLLCVILGFWLTTALIRAEILTYPDLVRRLTDLEALAIPPSDGERAGMASSYNRKSRYDAATDRYIAWDMNRGDSSGHVRRLGDDLVLADIKGPGCLWRIWAATAREGHVRIFLDGQPLPTVDLPFSGYFDGQHEPFNRPALVYEAARGLNNYTPISFQKSCKVLAAKNWGEYYQITYSQFPDETQVPTFTLPLSATDAAALDLASMVFQQAGRSPVRHTPDTRTLAATVSIGARSRVSIAELTGPGAITSLRLKFPLPADTAGQRALLRQLALSIRWDNDRQPAVWSPLGDFFGLAGGAVPFRTLPSGLTEDGWWYSYWHMPYSSRADVVVENDSDEPVALQWEIMHVPSPRAGELLRFHAKWHGDLPALRRDRQPDWELLTTTGRGRYVGTQLHIWNPRGGWWGEGDEKFFVDGEAFPSFFGTGTEDYFGYAWCSPLAFARPLHGQPINEDNRGHVSVSRWHTADNVPFQQGFHGALEKYFTTAKATEFAAVVYWYLAAGGTDPLLPVPVEERLGPWSKPALYREAGALEAEDLTIVNQRISFSIQPRLASALHIAPGVVSGDAVMLWRVDQDGQRLSLGGIHVPVSGRYRVLGRFVSGPNLGTVQFELDGAPLGAPLDFFSTTPVSDYSGSSPVELGTAELSAGDHVLTFIGAGRNPASDSHWVAVDYVQLVPVP